MVSLLHIVRSNEVSPVLTASLEKAVVGCVCEREFLRYLGQDLGAFDYYPATRKNLVTGLGQVL